MSSAGEQSQAKAEAEEAVELVLFQVAECYVYLIPPRKTAASYRADEWNVNKWAWEGTLKVVSKGEECIIKLEDKNTGELYARAFLREDEPHPVEPVIDSSRYFVLRVEENIDGRQRHAFIGLGFRERPQAYDFQAALHDHMKYLNKKKTAEEMVQHYEKSSSVDYSLKEASYIKPLEHNVIRSRPDIDLSEDLDQLVWWAKKPAVEPGFSLVSYFNGPIGQNGLAQKESGAKIKSAFFEQGLNKLSFNEKANSKEAPVSLKLPPPPPSPVSPTDSGIAASPFKAEFPSQDQPAANTGADTTPFKAEFPSSHEQPAADNVASSPPPKAEAAPQEQATVAEKAPQESVDDDFGDFQAAG
uniref:NECAP PHear domain-containing protein n=1 Tax=Oryza barthii TaxID=65489 RepID=A0A0D3ER78_9ORYZ